VENNKYKAQRDIMVRDQIKGRGFKDEKVIEAFNRVPRHLFVDQVNRDQAYEDFPLPIGKGQTISQPYIVALMTGALDLEGGEKVLEIGTGSGYQSAILAELVSEVYTIERIPELQERAREILKAIGYNNIFYKIGDGIEGWPEKAPFDGVIITAAVREVPSPLLEQLSPGGRIVAPVGGTREQELLILTRGESGFEEQTLGKCRFVPLK